MSLEPSEISKPNLKSSAGSQASLVRSLRFLSLKLMKITMTLSFLAAMGSLIG